MKTSGRISAFFLKLLKENSSPPMLAAAAAVSTFLAILPLMSLHTAVILAVAVRFRLNKVMALSIQNLYMPPFFPFLCIEAGHFALNGTFLTELTLKSVAGELHLRLWEWLVGSLIVAPPASAAAFGAVWAVATLVQGRGGRRGEVAA
jgi:uncharacterized protein (DUF2062 family)